MPVTSANGIQGGLPGDGYIDTNPIADPVSGGASCGGGTLDDDQIACTTTGTGTGASGSGSAAAAPAPPPPPPPTHPEIVARICPPAPAPAIGHNPRDHGVTGLSTWLWSAGPHTSSRTGTIRGYDASCTLQASTFTFDTNDPHASTYGHPPTHTTTTPGHEGETTPAQHTYEVKGTYPLSLTITWTRTTTAGQDATTSTATTGYQVKEVVTGMTTD